MHFPLHSNISSAFNRETRTRIDLQRNLKAEIGAPSLSRSYFIFGEGWPTWIRS